MENIENNNAVDYIPNRNEIERLVEPVIISFHQEEQQQPLFDRSNPFVGNRAYDVELSNNPFVDITDNEHVVVNIDFSEDEQTVIESNDQIRSAVKLLDEAISLESSLSERSVTDVNSVEEALRALDYAISGEESLLQPNEEEEFECYTNENDKISCQDIANSFQLIDKTKDIANKTSNLCNDFIDEIRKEAEILVNSVIEESQEKIIQGLMPTKLIINQTYDNSVLDDCAIDSDKIHKNENATSAVHYRKESNVSDEQYLTRDFQSVGSVENLCFDNIVLEASTPFVKGGRLQNLNTLESPLVANKTFDVSLMDSEVFESPVVNDIGKMDILGVSPLVSETNADQLGCNINGTFVKSEKNLEDSTECLDSPVANETFEVKKPRDITPSVSDNKQLNKTFPLEPLPNPINTTFTSSDDAKDAESNAVMKTECPTIKIDKEDSTSVDMTTVTPVNTPIELNYSLDSWDQFISNSMSQQLEMPKNYVEMQPCTSAQAAYAECNASGWFLHSKKDGKLRN